MSEQSVASPESIHPILKSAIGKAPGEGEEEIFLALGCFWGAEKAFYKTEGVVTTAVGYIAGHVQAPTYSQVCSGVTGHTEAVRVVFDKSRLSLDELLRIFWESHDPTQGNRQGNDIGTQYRSGIYTTGDEQLKAAKQSCDTYGQALARSGRGAITTEIEPAGPFWFAELYHQQYLHKNPGGYCGLGGCGVKFPD